MKRVFALIRAYDDRALLAAIAPVGKPAAKRRDPLVRELAGTLKPVMAPAREKAELLVEHLARKHRRKLAFEPGGLADAARQLRKHFTDAEISLAAKSLVARLARLHGGETVV
jgi:hypothetical protein